MLPSRSTQRCSDKFKIMRSPVIGQYKQVILVMFYRIFQVPDAFLNKRHLTRRIIGRNQAGFSGNRALRGDENVFSGFGFADVTSEGIIILLENEDIILLFAPKDVLINLDRKSTRLNSSHVKISYA